MIEARDDGRPAKAGFREVEDEGELGEMIRLPPHRGSDEDADENGCKADEEGAADADAEIGAEHQSSQEEDGKEDEENFNRGRCRILHAHEFRGLLFSEELGSFFCAELAFLDLFENLVSGEFCRDGCVFGVSEELVDEIETLANGRIGDAEFFFGLTDVSAAAEENADEVLEVGGKPEERRDTEGGIDLGIAALAGEAGDLKFPVTKWAAGDQGFRFLVQYRL